MRRQVGLLLTSGITFKYRINDILSIILLIRVATSIRLLKTFLNYHSNAAQRLTKVYSTKIIIKDLWIQNELSLRPQMYRARIPHYHDLQSLDHNCPDFLVCDPNFRARQPQF